MADLGWHGDAVRGGVGQRHGRVQVDRAAGEEQSEQAQRAHRHEQATPWRSAVAAPRWAPGCGVACWRHDDLLLASLAFARWLAPWRLLAYSTSVRRVRLTHA